MNEENFNNIDIFVRRSKLFKTWNLSSVSDPQTREL